MVMVAVGWALGKITDYGPSFMPLAVVVAVIMALTGYYSGDKIALLATGAKPITKDENSYVYRLVENLAITAGLPAPKIYLIPSPALNAFATGRDPKHASIALTTGIIEKLENEELEGVIAHELSHIGNYDTRLMVLILVLIGTIGMLSDWGMRTLLWGRGGRRSSEGGGQAQAIFAIVGIVLLILAPLIAQLMRLAVSRRREYLADASAVLLTRYPEGLAKALEKISTGPTLNTANAATAPLFIANPFAGTGKKLANLFSTHPPIESRVQKLREMMG